MNLQEIQQQAHAAASELLQIAQLQPGDLMVIGCSTSEVGGQRIGRASSMEIAEALFAGITRAAGEYQIDLAFQCCEHLNRALVVERHTAERFGLEEVSVIPVPQAGGAMAATAMQSLNQPIVVETIRAKAKAGLDIGDTLIGMHLRPVAVPVRLQNNSIGAGHLHAARSRPKLIGGARAQYDSAQTQEANRS